MPARQDTLVHELGRRSASEIVPQLHAEVAVLGGAELRGYVRARALPVVRREVRQAIATRRLPPAREASLIASTLEHVVHRVVCELQAPPVAAIPLPHVGSRRAA